MKQYVDNKCESCGNTMVFSPSHQALRCEHCGNVNPIPNMALAGKKAYSPQVQVLKNVSRDGMYECASCGAKTRTDGMVSGLCPYCGAHSTKQLHESIDYTPDAIVPFKITKDEAKRRYKEWLKTRKFVPNKLQHGAKINKMEGTYIPVWEYDFDVNTNYSGVGIEKHERTSTRIVNGQAVQYTETYETRHPFSGSRFDSFVNCIESGTSVINQRELTELGNFGLETLKVYDTAYLVGYLSSTFDIDVHKGFDYIKSEAKNSISDRIEDAYDYDDIEDLNLKSTFSNIKWRYIYLPVYICNFMFNRKQYRFLVNGHTGYVKGKVPRSGWKIAGLVLGILAVVGAIVYLAVTNS